MTIKKISTIIIGLLTITLTAVSCSDDDFEMNSTFISSNTYAELSDATPINLTTFRLDSVLTSSQNVVWVGKANKDIIGDIHSRSYVRLDEPSITGYSSGYGWLQGKEYYDSCTLVLRHTGSYEGDTTKTFNIQVRALSKLLEFGTNQSYFYNVDSFPVDSVIGRYAFKPRPITRPRLRFRLNDTFGQHLRDFIISTNNYNSNIVSQQFQSFMKGIRIESTDSIYDTNALLAFQADSVQLVLHSHIRGMEAIKVERILKCTATNKQFNQVWTENTESPFDQLTQRYIQVSEDSTNYRSVMYEGLGYYTRINLPGIENIRNSNNYYHVVKATLKLYALEGSYDKRRIPSTFYLFEVNKGNVITNPLYKSTGAQVSSTLVYDPYDRSQMYYYADITYYINTLLDADTWDENTGLVMTWGNGMSPVNYDFMIFNGHGIDLHRSELEVIYYYYDVETR